MLAPAFLSATTSTIWISLACFSSMFGMSTDNDDFSDDNTTEIPSGLLPNAAMTQVDVGAKSYFPACGPLATFTLALVPTTASACGNAGVASASDAASRLPENLRGIFTVT